MRRSGLLLVGLLAAATLGAAGYIGYRSATAGSEPAPPPPEIVPVTRGEVQQTVSAPGKVVDRQQATLSLSLSGQLAGVYVRPGQHVQAGKVLAGLATLELERSMAEAELRLRQAQLDLASVLRPASERQIRDAERAVEQAAAELGVAQRSLDAVLSSPLLNETLEDAQDAYDDASGRYELALAQYERDEIDYWFVDHFQQIAQGKQQALLRLQQQAGLSLAGAQGEVIQARHEYQQAQDELEALRDGPDPLVVEAHRLTVAAAELALAAARTALEAATVVAPFDGVVVHVAAAPGDYIPAGRELIVLTDPSAVEVEVTVIEEDLPSVQLGQKVELFLDARPEAIVTGQVTRIVPRRIPDADRPLYPVVITPTHLPPGILPGMTVDASIVIARRSNVLCLPRSLVRARHDGTAQVEIWTADRIEQRTVQVGLRGDVLVEILAGLHEGEQVVAQ